MKKSGTCVLYVNFVKFVRTRFIQKTVGTREIHNIKVYKEPHKKLR